MASWDLHLVKLVLWRFIPLNPCVSSIIMACINDINSESSRGNCLIILHLSRTCPAWELAAQLRSWSETSSVNRTFGFIRCLVHVNQDKLFEIINLNNQHSHVYVWMLIMRNRWKSTNTCVDWSITSPQQCTSNAHTFSDNVQTYLSTSSCVYETYDRLSEWAEGMIVNLMTTQTNFKFETSDYSQGPLESVVIIYLQLADPCVLRWEVVVKMCARADLPQPCHVRSRFVCDFDPLSYYRYQGLCRCLTYRVILAFTNDGEDNLTASELLNPKAQINLDSQI
jgi:hypothetical protein